jgi:hypothetical protein
MSQCIQLLRPNALPTFLNSGKRSCSVNSFGTQPTNSLNKGLSLVPSCGAVSHSEGSGSCSAIQAHAIFMLSCHSCKCKHECLHKAPIDSLQTLMIRLNGCQQAPTAVSTCSMAASLDLGLDHCCCCCCCCRQMEEPARPHMQERSPPTDAPACALRAL